MKTSTGLIIGIVLLSLIVLIDWNGTKTQTSQPSAQMALSTNTSTTPTSQNNTLLNLQEVALHNTETSCYTIIADKVYDLTSWIAQHPGGSKAILRLCGNDGTSAFTRQHGSSKKAATTLEEFLLGDLQ